MNAGWHWPIQYFADLSIEPVALTSRTRDTPIYLHGNSIRVDIKIFIDDDCSLNVELIAESKVNASSVMAVFTESL